MNRSCSFGNRETTRPHRASASISILWRCWLPILTLLHSTLLSPAATLTIISTAPVPGLNDISNFAGAPTDGQNVNNGATYADGGANDAFTYVAGDRASQGQTFITGGDTNGYTLTTIWLRHVGYTNNTSTTYWAMNSGVTLTVRVTDPAQVGTSGFVVRNETYATTGNEGWGGSFNSANGSGNWLRFTLASPLALTANKTYGFDVTSATTGAYFEWLGTSNNLFTGGSAYKGNTTGNTDNTLTALTGDRVFVLELTLGGYTNPPSSTNYISPLTVADPFPNERVQLLPSRFNQNRELHRTGYLAWLDFDRLLWPFRNNAGLTQPSGATHLGGWEGGSGFTAVRGHMLGHYLSAAARMYADTGDATFLTKINYLVTELRKCQNALSTNELAAGRVYGYLSGFPSSDFTTLENNPSAATVPFYTIHKILSGLVDAYRYTTNGLALDIAIGMSDYHSWRVAQLSTAQIEAMFRTDNGNTEEWGGMNEALTDLYLLSTRRSDTNAVRHLTFAQVFHRDWFINPLVANQDQLNGLHANTHVPEVTGFARVAAVLNTNDAQRVRLYTAASNFWHLVTGQHWLVLGGNSYGEHFSTPGKESGPGGSALAWNTAETCNTHNMLRLTSQLFQQQPSVEYADYYEHALYNHILGSLETNAGMTTYFVPMNSGHFKTYCRPEGSSWCCTGTGIENPTRYNEAIYFHKTNVLWVNLFIPSQLSWAERNLTVKLETGFPNTNTVKFTMLGAQPTNAIVRIRIPSWIAATPTVKLNGVVQPLAPPAGTYLELNRTWSNGDVVELTLPINLRVDHSMDDVSQVSLFYGPILLAGTLGTNGMPTSDQAQDQWDYSSVPTVAAPILIGDNANDPANWVQGNSNTLTFNAVAGYAGSNAAALVSLRPFFDVHHERYAVYWNLIAPAGVSVWTDGSSPPNWSLAGNWNFVPTNQCVVEFGLAAGGATTNDLTPGIQLNGVRFSDDAGSYVLNGNSILLAGDVVNDSANEQRINLPIELNGGLAWTWKAATADLTVGNVLNGIGALDKQGSHTLTLLSNCTYTGSTRIGAGELQLGNGGAAGSIGNSSVTLDAGAALAFNRADIFVVNNTISGAGGVVKRGSGTMQLSRALSNSGPTVIEAGKIQMISQFQAVLLHRWSFSGNLNDSVGGANASVVDVGGNNTSLNGNSITLTGGVRSSSDYVSLGSNLLPKDNSPVTIELWATQVSAKSWARIFDVGVSSSENLFMTWSQGTDIGLDRIEWKDSVTATANNTVAPYTVGTEYHIAMAIEPGAGNGSSTRMTWYAAPSGNTNLGAARGSLETANTPTSLNDTNFWLGRSEYGSDATANASYSEVRLWNRALSASDLQQLHTLGANGVGTFATNVTTGGFCAQSDLQLWAGALVDLAGTTQQVASVSGISGATIQLNGGRLIIGNDGDPDANFAGSISGPGSVVVNGVLRLVGNATLAANVALTNNGTLDVMTWSGTLPVGFVNYGTLLDRSLIKIDAMNVNMNDFKLSIYGFSGHTYQLQYRDNLNTGSWQNYGNPVAGSNATVNFTHTAGAVGNQKFYRITVGP